MPVLATVEELIEHLRFLGTIASDETDAFAELDHGLQCAALLATAEPTDVELQVAGLIHDLAHPWDEAGMPRHAVMGAAAVRGLLGARMAALIEGHVPAKRYLVTVDPAYRALLSSGSIETLAAQGGDLTPAHAAAFEANPDWRATVALRRADDAAKVVGAQVPDLDHWLPAIAAIAARRR